MRSRPSLLADLPGAFGDLAIAAGVLLHLAVLAYLIAGLVSPVHLGAYLARRRPASPRHALLRVCLAALAGAVYAWLVWPLAMGYGASFSWSSLAQWVLAWLGAAATVALWPTWRDRGGWRLPDRWLPISPATFGLLAVGVATASAGWTPAAPLLAALAAACAQWATDRWVPPRSPVCAAVALGLLAGFATPPHPLARLVPFEGSLWETTVVRSTYGPEPVYMQLYWRFADGEIAQYSEYGTFQPVGSYRRTRPWRLELTRAGRHAGHVEARLRLHPFHLGWHLTLSGWGHDRRPLVPARAGADELVRTAEQRARDRALRDIEHGKQRHFSVSPVGLVRGQAPDTLVTTWTRLRSAGRVDVGRVHRSDPRVGRVLLSFPGAAAAIEILEVSPGYADVVAALPRQLGLDPVRFRDALARKPYDFALFLPTRTR